MKKKKEKKEEETRTSTPKRDILKNTPFASLAFPIRWKIEKKERERKKIESLRNGIATNEFRISVGKRGKARRGGDKRRGGKPERTLARPWCTKTRASVESSSSRDHGSRSNRRYGTAAGTAAVERGDHAFAFPRSSLPPHFPSTPASIVLTLLVLRLARFSVREREGGGA